MNLEFLLNYDTIAVMAVISAIIVGLAEAVARVGLNKKFIPLVDIVLGFAITCVWFLPMGQPIHMCIIVGIITGLSACGLFSGVKNVIEGFKKVE